MVYDREQVTVGKLEQLAGFGLASTSGAMITLAASDPMYFVLGIPALVGGAVLMADSMRRTDSVIASLYQNLVRKVKREKPAETEKPVETYSVE